MTVSLPKYFDANPPWDEREMLYAVCDDISKGGLIESCEMKYYLESQGKFARFNNEVYCGVMKRDDKCIKIAYKPKNFDDRSSAYAESIAYQIYERAIAPSTGNHFIPPTVVRTMSDGRVASCQYFVETKAEEDMWNETFRKRVFAEANPENVNEIALFNSIFNNWDKHPGNYMATWNNDRFCLANIDNEGIENSGDLDRWGQRSYIPALFCDQAHPKIKLGIEDHCTFEDFKATLKSYGFNDMQNNWQAIFVNLMQRGDSTREVLIDGNILKIRYHDGNKAAFPLPKEPYSNKIVDVYRNLDIGILRECYQPLADIDRRFTIRVDEVVKRRNLFLNSIKNTNEEHKI